MRKLAGVLAACAVLATGCAHQPEPEPTPEPSPYCRAVADAGDYLTVSGPAGGKIAVDGKPAGTLVKADADEDPETVSDAAPWDGVRYNIVGPGRVTVDGHDCT